MVWIWTSLKHRVTFFVGVTLEVEGVTIENLRQGLWNWVEKGQLHPPALPRSPLPIEYDSMIRSWEPYIKCFSHKWIPRVIGLSIWGSNSAQRSSLSSSLKELHVDILHVSIRVQWRESRENVQSGEWREEKRMGKHFKQYFWFRVESLPGWVKWGIENARAGVMHCITEFIQF